MIAIPNLIFYAFAVLSIGTALVVVTSRNVFHSALALTICMSVIGGFFALIGADFLAASQILVYVGGVMIIMLFVIMLSQQPLDALQKQTNTIGVLGALAALTVAGALINNFKEAFQTLGTPSEIAPTSASIGRLLLGDMLVPFEAISLVLLVALVGAVLFGTSSKSEASR